MLPLPINVTKQCGKKTRRTNVLAENRMPRLCAKARSAQNVDDYLREPGKIICQRTKNFRENAKYAMDDPPTQRDADKLICHAKANFQSTDSSSAWQIQLDWRVGGITEWP